MFGKKWAVWLLIPSVLLNLLLGYKFLAKRENTFTVAQVVDGDTFKTSDGSIVRIYGIEAPEIGLCGGPEAKEQLEKLILGKGVRMNIRVRDSFERAVAEVYLDDQYIANSMVASGWALYKSVNPAEKEALKESGQKAREEKKGVFGEKCTQIKNTQQPQCLIKGNINAQNSDKTYHFPGCGRYEEFPVELWRGDQWFCSEKEAQAAGFVKSKNCFGRAY